MKKKTLPFNAHMRVKARDFVTEVKSFGQYIIGHR
jgi:hypothetical protein